MDIRKLYHKVVINIATCQGDKKEVLRTYNLCIPDFLAKLWLGRTGCKAYVFIPGDCVKGIEIKELSPK